MLFDIILTTFVDAEIAQLVEQRTENPRVGSSILPLGILPFIPWYVEFFCADVAQWLEQLIRNQ